MNNKISLQIDDLLRQLDQGKKPHITPEDVELFCGLLCEECRYADAFKLMRHGVELYPNNNKILTLKAWVLINNNLLAEASAVISQLKARHVDSYPINICMGAYFVKQNRIDEAQKQFAAALGKCGTKPERMLVLYNVAVFLNNTGYYEKAIPYWEDYGRLEGYDSTDMSNLAYAYCTCEQFDKSITLYKKILRKNQTDWQIWYGLSMAYLNMGDYRNAIETSNKVLSINPFASRVYYNMGVIYFRTYEHQKTIDSMTEYISLTANVEPDTYISLGASWLELKNYDEAIKYLNKACEMMPDSATPYYYLGMAYFEKNDTASALESYKKTVELDPLEPMYLFMIAEVYSKMEDNEKTKEYLYRGLELEPNEIHAWCELFRLEFIETAPLFDHEKFIKENRKKYGDSAALKLLEAFFNFTVFYRNDDALRLLGEVAVESPEVINDALQNDILADFFKKKEIKKLLANKKIKV